MNRIGSHPTDAYLSIVCNVPTMPEYSSPSVPREWLAAFAALTITFLADTFLLTGQILLGVMTVVPVVGLYLAWRFVVSFEAIADAQQRLARDTEDE